MLSRGDGSEMLCIETIAGTAELASFTGRQDLTFDRCLYAVAIDRRKKICAQSRVQASREGSLRIEFFRDPSGVADYIATARNGGIPVQGEMDITGRDVTTGSPLRFRYVKGYLPFPGENP